MTNFEKELQALKTWDEIQSTVKVKGFDFIITAGHGYLVVPKTSIYFNLAKKIVKCGFTGKLAIYLEEDSEAPEFLKRLPQGEAVLAQ